VYQLLGGKTKDRLPVYATSSEPALAKKMGFKGAKFPLPYGPGAQSACVAPSLSNPGAASNSRWPDMSRTASAAFSRLVVWL